MPKFDSKRAGTRLREIRESKGLTPTDLARASGKGRDQLARYEHQGMPTRPQPETLTALATGLGIEPTELRQQLGYPDTMPVARPERVQGQSPEAIIRHLERIEKTLEDIKQRLDLALAGQPADSPDRRNVDRAFAAIRPALDRAREEVGQEALDQALASLASSDPQGPRTTEPRS